ncbi:MAG: hypothetical protein JWM87_2318 [Candidatus Eremiobacteraeota bacterium]|nr:hypothetical protein [Candidatus Eremiobacteraeota bacterium]
MLEAIVGVALRAILASVLLGGVLAVLVLLATRMLALTAATRHALWTMALIATAVMPLAGVGVSVWKATAPQFAPQRTVAVTNGSMSSPVHTVTQRSSQPAPAHGAQHAAAGTASHDRSTRTAATGDKTANTLTAPADSKASAATSAPAAALASIDRFAFARWTPRMSRNLAMGVAGIWALGALAGLIGLAGSIVRVRGLKRRSSPLDGALADELPWLTEVGPGREIYLRLSYETETPVAIGFRRPVILIPTELATADGLAAIEQLILHEHAHLRRHDDWTNLLQRAIERIFWFNPVVWLVGRRIALEREIASDDAVVEKTGEAHAYATSLWKLAREMRMPEHAVVAPGALLTRKQIAVRIEQLLDKKRARLHRSPGAALGVVLASVLAVGFVASSAPAVELPASAAEPPAAPATAWHAERAHKHDAPVRVVAVVKPVNPKDARGVLAPAAKPAPAAMPQFRKTVVADTQHQAVKYEIFSKRITSTGASSPSKAGAALRERVVTVYVHDSPAPHVAHDQALPPVSVPAVPPMPVMPAMPVVPAMPAIKPDATHALRLAKATETKVRLAQARDRIRLQAHAQNLADVGPEIGRVLQEAMASIPREIAQEEQGSTSGTKRARLDGVKLSRELIASCVGCSFRNADIRGVDLHGLKISANNFAGADMRGVNLSGAKLTGVSLRGANLSNADLRNAELAGVELRGANFDSVQFEGIKLVGVSFQGVSLRGTALRSVIANCTGCDFSRMDLHGQDLHDITLTGANLAHADLHNANLSGVRFSGVELSHANLTGADLTNARLDGCSLSGTELRGARLTGLTMTGTSGLDG